MKTLTQLTVDADTLRGVVIVSIGKESVILPPDQARKIAYAIERKADSLDGANFHRHV